jgi:hypothetical protein
MRGLIFLVVAVPFVLLLASQLQQTFHEPPESELSEAERVERLLENSVFNTPKKIDVLLNKDHVDKQARVEYKTVILKTDEEYLPRSPKSLVAADKVMQILHNDMPEQDFGQAVGDKGGHFRWLTPGGEEWTVSSIETSLGFISRWKRRADMFQVLREE